MEQNTDPQPIPQPQEIKPAKRKYHYTKKTGRPSKLTPELALKIFVLSRKGLKDEEIAHIFDVRTRTIHNWKKDPDFFHSLKENKEYADAMMERSLYERGMGYEHEEDEIFCHPKTGKVTVVKIVKHYAPDPTSIIFWLKNRKPKEWRDKVDIDHGFSDENYEKLRSLSIQEIDAEINAILTGNGKAPRFGSSPN